MSNNLVIIGAQWGDEGKGKIVHYLSKTADYVVRYQGGSNAGHTVYKGDKKYVFHLLPSGIIEENKICLIGSGVVLNPDDIVSEIEELQGKGIDFSGRLFISENCHVVLAYHKILDALKEKKEKIGTTQKGIGPAYTDKVSRIGIRFVEYLDDENFENLLDLNLNAKKDLLIDVDLAKLKSEILESRNKIVNKLRPLAANVVKMVNQAFADNKKLIFESAQGSMLDIDHGTYPYVTSSNPLSGGVCCGCGIGPNKIKDVFGIIKAYVTRVGEGPFPTELNDEIGQNLREEGNEFGATTGRPRRCGWFDLVVAKTSILLNGITSLVLTKLDVLDNFSEIKICVSYDIDGKTYDYIPSNRYSYSKIKPNYISVKGWQSSSKEAQTFEELPENAKAYIKKLEELLSCPISIVSVGKEDRKTIVREKIF